MVIAHPAGPSYKGFQVKYSTYSALACAKLFSILSI